MLPLVESNDERAKLWEQKCLNLIKIGGQFPAIVRALGRLDSFLRKESRSAVGDLEETEFPNLSVIEDYLALSQLWVFGAYELLRSIDQKLSEGDFALPMTTSAKVKEMKMRFARIRVPLAKLEPANRFRLVDEVPKGACVVSSAKEKGWCWQLNANTYVWRHDLGDELLSLLDLFPAPWSGSIQQT
jgi:hypothetical protein